MATVASGNEGTPYANVATLDAITNGTTTNGVTPYVYWRVARTFAMIELESFREANDWYNAELSERPVLVYDSKSRPKYYEYRVVRNGEEIGAITAVAQKKDGGPTAYVLPHPSDYSGLSTKAGDGFKIVANGYPHVAYGIVSKAGDEVTTAIDPATGESVTPESDPMEYALTHPEAFTNSNVTVTMVLETASNQIISNNDYWQSTKSIESNLIILSTNEEFIAMIAQSQSKAQDFQASYGSMRVVHSRVVNGFTGRTRGWWDPIKTFGSNGLDWFSSGYGVWCGPGVAGLALTYYGYTSKIRYSYNYIKLCRKMNITDMNNGGTWASDVVAGIRWASDNHINGIIINPWWDWWKRCRGVKDSFQNAKDVIERNDLFILSRTHWNNHDKYGHWRLGVGYRWINNYHMVDHWRIVTQKRKVLWWTIWEPVVQWYRQKELQNTTYWYLLTDNGYEWSFSPHNKDRQADWGQRKYLGNGYSQNIFWEKYGTSDYGVTKMILLNRQ